MRNKISHNNSWHRAVSLLHFSCYVPVLCSDVVAVVLFH